MLSNFTMLVMPEKYTQHPLTSFVQAGTESLHVISPTLLKKDID